MSADAILIAAYDPLWPETFEVEASRIRRALGALALRVDHVGSTSVPGLDAKPVIDIQISVALLHPFVGWKPPLEALGYVHVPHPDDATYPFLHRPERWPHSHHIHVCTAGGEEERDNLAFRDYLRDHASVAQEYAALKRELAERYSAKSFASRNAYAGAKSDFIRPLLARALAEGYPRFPSGPE